MQKLPPGSGQVKRLRFGKYKGELLSAVPSEYLTFLIDSATTTIEECKEELTRREAAAEATLPWVQRVVETGYRELARRHHPDHGGDGDSMRELNAAIEALREMVRQ
jgi:hypothetical protein